jgi:hypothetical protein
MAAGGIVAFQEGGRAEDEIDPALNEEMMRFIESQRQAPAQARPRSESLAQRGIRTLIGERTPQEVFNERQRMAQEAIGYNPEEQSIFERQLKDRESIDARRFDPERTRSEGLTRWLLGAGGRTGIGSVLGGGGAAAVNYRDAIEREERNALVDRQKQEAGIVDVGPAARAAGMKYGTEAERTAMTGLAQGTGDAVRLEQIQAAAARAGAGPDEFKRLSVAEIRFDNARKQILGQMKERSIEPGSPESAPYYQQINQIGQSIYQRMQIADLFVPDPVPGAPSSPAAAAPGFFGRIFGAGTPPSAPSGGSPRVVPFSSLQN